MVLPLTQRVQIHGRGARTAVSEGVRIDLAGVPEHLPFMSTSTLLCFLRGCFAFLLCHPCSYSIIISKSPVLSEYETPHSDRHSMESASAIPQWSPEALPS